MSNKEVLVIKSTYNQETLCMISKHITVYSVHYCIFSPLLYIQSITVYSRVIHIYGHLS